MAVKAALQRSMAPLSKGEGQFSLLIAVYPWCGDFPLDFRSSGTAIHILLGSDDTYTRTEACLEYVKKLEQGGANVTVKIYPRAKHGWDVPGPADWSDPQGQNASKCFYDEIEPGTWIERGSRIKVMENHKPTGNRDKALSKCMTLGVSGGYSQQVHSETLQHIRAVLRETFRLR